MENPSDIVFFNRSQCSRQHAYDAFRHAGMSEAEAAQKAADLPLATSPTATFAFDPSEPRDEQGRWSLSESVKKLGKFSPTEIAEAVLKVDPRGKTQHQLFMEAQNHMAAAKISRAVLAVDPKGKTATQISAEAARSLGLDPSIVKPEDYAIGEAVADAITKMLK